MNYQLAKTRIQTLISQRNAGWVFSFGLLFLCFMQTLAIIYLGSLCHQVRIIERPIGLDSSFWVSERGVSSTYLAGMSRYLLTLYLTVSPKNVDNQRQVFLNSVAPESYDVLKRQLVSLDEKIKKESLTAVFYSEQTQIDSKHLMAKIEGELQIRAGNATPMTQRKAFTLQFIFREGQLYLSQLTETSK